VMHLSPMRLRKFGEDASTRLLRLRKSYRSEILCIRSTTGLKVCYSMCFEACILEGLAHA
jgi:hypothetical protein